MKHPAQFFIFICIFIVLTSCVSTQLQNHEIQDSQPYYHIDIQYPQIEARSKHTNTINTYIHNHIFETKQEFLKTCQTYYDPNIFSAPWELYIRWEPAEISPERLSVLLETYTYTGGAHGMTSQKAINFNLKTGTEILLEHLAQNLAPQESFQAWLEQVSNIVYPQAVKTLKNHTNTENTPEPNLAWIAEGTAPTPKNYQVFTLQENNIRFYFGQYQIAPYYMGINSVTIPISELTIKN